jgi:hypothetical protein
MASPYEFRVQSSKLLNFIGAMLAQVTVFPKSFPASSPAKTASSLAAGGGSDYQEIWRILTVGLCKPSTF